MNVYRYTEVNHPNIKLEFVLAAKSHEDAFKNLGISYSSFYKHGMETKSDYCLDIALSNKNCIFYRLAGHDATLKKLDPGVSVIEMCEKIANEIY